MSTIDDEASFRIEYDEQHTKCRDFVEVMPPREPDYVHLEDVSLTHTGIPKHFISFWFKEGRVLEVQNEYDDSTKPSSLNVQRAPGVCNICPNSGHLMYLTKETYHRWEFVSRATQDAFVNWLTDQHLATAE